MKTVQLVRLNPEIDEALAKDPAYFDAIMRGDWSQVADCVHDSWGEPWRSCP